MSARRGEVVGAKIGGLGEWGKAFDPLSRQIMSGDVPTYG